MPPAEVHTLTPGQVLAQLESSDSGLSGDEVKKRLAKHGPNALPEKKAPSAFWMFVRQLRSPLIYLLLVAAVLALALDERIRADSASGPRSCAKLAPSTLSYVRVVRSTRVTSARLCRVLESLMAVTARLQDRAELKPSLLVTAGSRGIS